MTSRAGFVAIIGLPNAGKSTLINSFIKEKVSIVTHKAQTTRANFRGILTKGSTQFIFVDTPGIHRPKRKIDRSMVAAAHQAWLEADVVLVLMDARKGFVPEIEEILESMEKSKLPCILALNKVDKIKKEKLLPLMEKAQKKQIFTAIFAISALKEDGLEGVLEEIEKYLPEGPFLYDPETLTDTPMRQIAAETTREKAFLLLQQELPYELVVETVTYEEREKGDVVIHQDVIISRDSQKKIVLGKGGSMIKKISENARKDLEKLLGVRVHLFLKVKVRPNWQENSEILRTMGLEPVKK